MHAPRALARVATSLLALALLAPLASATWSIVVVDMQTGEVGVASATCVANINLIPILPVIRPGEGAAAVQSSRDPSGARKLVIWQGFEAALAPSEIFTNLQSIGGHQNRQYGIVGWVGAPVAWTGSGAGQGKHEVTGVVGTLKYAIQGNVLVGREPVDAAEAALLSTPGDLGQKVMAAMEAARAMGGDGRCSCSQFQPTSCGAPPPGTWKSAHTGFVILSRVGDGLGVCNGGTGCASGNYYLRLNFVGGNNDPDPVLELQARYDLWRANLAGRPDHVLSVVTPSATQLKPDGSSSADVLVQLLDVEGAPLTSGGAAVTLTNLSGAPAVTTPTAVVDHGDGTYSFSLVAGTTTGADDWELAFDDGSAVVKLYPRLVMPVVDVTPETYCTAGASASGCAALLAATGTPSASAPSGFVATAADVEGSKDGQFYFGVNGRQAVPWGNGTSYRCVVPPTSRAGLLAASGTNGACDGSFTQDLNTLWVVNKPAVNPGAGNVVQLQLWYRDPQNTSNRTTSFSDALEFPVCP
jgi:hypothetical protein